MTKYTVTARGVLWCLGWFGIAILFLSIFGNTYPRGWSVTVIYFTILLVPDILIFWNRFATKLGLHKEVQS